MGFLYIIQAGDEDYYKIGISSTDPRVNRRVNSLQTGNHLPLSVKCIWETDAYITAERLMHLGLSPYISIGEWFHVKYEMIMLKLDATKQLLLGVRDVDPSLLSTVSSDLRDLMQSNGAIACQHCGEIKSSKTAVYGHYRTCLMRKKHVKTDDESTCVCLYCRSRRESTKEQDIGS